MATRFYDQFNNVTSPYSLGYRFILGYQLTGHKLHKATSITFRTAASYN